MILFAFTPPGNEFTFLRSSGEVDLYYRWVQVNRDFRTRELKAMMELSVPEKEVVSFLKDPSKAMQWLNAASVYKNVTSPEASSWTSYMLFSLPWPLADQDCYMQFDLARNCTGGAKINFVTKPQYRSNIEGVKRMEAIRGSIVIIPLSSKNCRVEFFFISEKCSGIPKWVSDRIIQKSVLEMLVNFREQMVGVGIKYRVS